MPLMMRGLAIDAFQPSLFTGRYPLEQHYESHRHRGYEEEHQERLEQQGELRPPDHGAHYGNQHYEEQASEYHQGRVYLRVEGYLLRVIVQVPPVLRHERLGLPVEVFLDVPSCPYYRGQVPE